MGGEAGGEGRGGEGRGGGRREEGGGGELQMQMQSSLIS